MIRLPWSARLGLANCVILFSLLSTTVAYGETPNGPGVKNWECISLRSNVSEYDLVCNLSGIWCNINFTWFLNQQRATWILQQRTSVSTTLSPTSASTSTTSRTTLWRWKGISTKNCEGERESQQIFLRWKKLSRHIFWRWKTFWTHFCMVKNILHTFFRVKIILTHFFKVKTFLAHLTLLPYILWRWKIIWTYFLKVKSFLLKIKDFLDTYC